MSPRRTADALARFTRRMTPPHLWDTYPVDFTVFLSAIGLCVRFLGANGVPQAILSGFAMAGAVLLFWGWLRDAPQTTRRGAAVMIATWAGQLTFLSLTFGTNAPNDFREAANLILGFAFLNLSVGLWWLLLPQRERKGRWWLHRISLSG